MDLSQISHRLGVPEKGGCSEVAHGHTLPCQLSSLSNSMVIPSCLGVVWPPRGGPGPILPSSGPFLPSLGPRSYRVRPWFLMSPGSPPWPPQAPIRPHLDHFPPHPGPCVLPRVVWGRGVAVPNEFGPDPGRTRGPILPSFGVKNGRFRKATPGVPLRPGSHPGPIPRRFHVVWGWFDPPGVVPGPSYPVPRRSY